MSAVITKFGVQADSQIELLEKLRADYRRIYGEDIELESNTPDGQIIGIQTQIASDMTELVKNLFASLFPSTAEGVFLDYNLDLIGILRNAGRAAIINISVQFIETITITIPAGSYSISIQNVVFTNDKDIVSGGIYSFTASESGVMQFSQGEQISINTFVQGVSVSYVSTVSNGSDYETDTDFRTRWLEMREMQDNSAPYIQNKIRQIDGVEDCRVYEVDHIPFDSLPANCIYVVIKSGAFDKDKVLDTIYASKPPGIRSYYTDTAEEQTKEFGEGKIKVGFDLAKYQDISSKGFRFSSKSRIVDIEPEQIAEVLMTMKFRIGQTVFVSDVDNFAMKTMPDWFARAGNSINGDDYLPGKTGVIYKFGEYVP